MRKRRFALSTRLFRAGANMVGTESRLRLVIETLEDIVRGASADPDRRLEYLRAQRAAIDAEIAAIESGKSIQTYRPAQIRERFQTAVDLLKALQSDFRAVEERFQTIAAMFSNCKLRATIRAAEYSAMRSTPKRC